MPQYRPAGNMPALWGRDSADAILLERFTAPHPLRLGVPAQIAVHDSGGFHGLCTGTDLPESTLTGLPLWQSRYVRFCGI